MGIDPNQGASTSTRGAKATSSSSASYSSATRVIDQSRGRKRKIEAVVAYGDGNEDEEPNLAQESPMKPKKQKAKQDPLEEKRLRKFRPKPPTNFFAVYERAITQRFFVLSRTLCGTPGCPEALFEISGSTGNIYNVCIARQPTCDCPHARAGNQCKHTLFVLKKVLRARTELVYQLALLRSELREIFDAAPDPSQGGGGGDVGGAGAEEAKNRKAVDGDCPICFEEMKAGAGKEPLVWCKAACGQNIHKQCFDMWAAIRRQSGKVTCPYCRSGWEADTEVVDVANIKRGGVLSREGYVNIADQLGLSRQRNYSTYSRWWSGHSSSWRRF